MHELVDYLVASFIPKESYDLVVYEEDDEIEIKILVDKEHIARLIGRQGKLAKAIRTIVKMKSQMSGQKCFVSIEDKCD